MADVSVRVQVAFINASNWQYRTKSCIDLLLSRPAIKETCPCTQLYLWYYWRSILAVRRVPFWNKATRVADASITVPNMNLMFVFQNIERYFYELNNKHRRVPSVSRRINPMAECDALNCITVLNEAIDWYDAVWMLGNYLIIVLWGCLKRLLPYRSPFRGYFVIN